MGNVHVGYLTLYGRSDKNPFLKPKAKKPIKQQEAPDIPQAQINTNDPSFLLT